MVHLLRKHQQTIMLLVTVVVIISFVAFWNNPTLRGGGMGGGSVGRIYDRSISFTDVQRGARHLRLCTMLGLQELVFGLQAESMTGGEDEKSFTFNDIVLRHEAEALGVVVTDEEIVNAIKAMPVFQTNGAYDAQKYQNAVQNVASLGFTQEQIEAAVQDELRLKKLKELLGTTVAAPVSEARERFNQRNQKTELSFVRLKDDDLAKDVTVSDEDIKKAFDERKPQTDEMRKVKYVAFVPTAEQKKLQGKDKAAVLQKLVDDANNFAVAMTVKDAKFEDVAQQAGATVAETPEFALNDPPKELDESPEAAQAAFKLTMEQPNSDAIRHGDAGYYVIQLTGITPARPETFDEAKPKLADSLKKERVAEAAGLKATEIHNKIDTEMKAGKSFAEAAEAAGQKAEVFPAFSFTQLPKFDQPGAMDILRGSMNLETGQLSEAIPASGGRLILHIDKRQPADDAAFDKEKAMIVESLSHNLRDAAFEIWFGERRKLAKIQVPVAHS